MLGPDQLLEQTTVEFRRRFGRAPRTIAMSPGRVNLIGDHTDYNAGLALPLAIERWTVVAADWEKITSRSEHVFYSCNLRTAERFSTPEDSRIGVDGWVRYVCGVFAGFAERGFQLPAIQAVVNSSIPLGAGLASSTALEVSVAILAEHILQTKIDRLELAKLCQLAEHRYAGVPCGLMDQLCCIHGRRDAGLLTDFRTLQVEPVAFGMDKVAFLIADSGVKHNLAASEYANRRSQCLEATRRLDLPSLRDLTLDGLRLSADELGPLLTRRAHHVVSENERVRQTTTAILDLDYQRAGELMFDSHQSLRDDFDVSCSELDVLVDVAQSNRS